MSGKKPGKASQNAPQNRRTAAGAGKAKGRNKKRAKEPPVKPPAPTITATEADRAKATAAAAHEKRHTLERPDGGAVVVPSLKDLHDEFERRGIAPDKGETLAARATRAAKATEEAAYLRADALDNAGLGDARSAEWARCQAAIEEREAAELLVVPGKLVHGTGGEVTITDPHPPANDYAAHAFLDTLEFPTATAAAASRARMNQALAHGHDTLAQATDAAETVGARDSLERMAAHQLAAAHGLVMKFLHAGAELSRKGQGHMTVNLPHAQIMMVEGNRILGTAIRLMGAYQNGHATLARIRQGGRQVVVHQYQNVQVNEGGQAVVTAGGPRGVLPGEGGEHGR